MGHESPDVLPNYVFEQYHIILFILFFISMNYVRTMIIHVFLILYFWLSLNMLKNCLNFRLQYAYGMLKNIFWILKKLLRLITFLILLITIF